MKVSCLLCKTRTNHESVAKFEANSGDNEYQWWATYEVIKCCGCETISYRTARWTEDDWVKEINDHSIDETLYPPRTSGRVALFDDFLNPEIPSIVLTIYLEVIKALNNSSPLLAAIGLRSIIEAICKQQKAKGRDLKSKIDDLAKQGLLAKNQAFILHSHRFLGNTAAHEIVAAPSEELLAAFDIAETMLKTIYVLPELQKRIKTGHKH